MNNAMREGSSLTPNPRGFLITGIVVALLGVAAIVFPVVASVAVGMTAGVTLLVAGIAATFHAATTSGWGGQILSVLAGLVTIAAGLMLMFFPLSGLVALTAIVVGFLIVSAVLKIALGFTLRPAERWGWPVVSGVLGLLLAGVILWSMPLGVAWVLGVLVGVDLVLTGSWMTALGIAYARTRRDDVDPTDWRGVAGDAPVPGARA